MNAYLLTRELGAPLGSGWLLEVVLEDHVHHAGTNRGLSDGSKMFKGSNSTHKVFQPALVCQNISRLARKVSKASCFTWFLDSPRHT